MTDRIIRAVLDGTGRIKRFPLLSGGTTPPVAERDYLFDWQDPNAYCGNAPDGSLETDAVWEITRIIIDEYGVVLDTDTLTNVKWSERTIIF